MTARSEARIYCDGKDATGCKSVFTPKAPSKIVSARHEARRSGWTQEARKYQRVDLCPTCSATCPTCGQAVKKHREDNPQ